MNTVFIGLGSNQGDRLHALQHAQQALGQLPETRLVQASSLYETQPVGLLSKQPMFLNQVLQLQTALSAQTLHQHTQALEGAAGRQRQQEIPGGPRTLDIDLLFYGQHIIKQPDLTVPHARLHERRFVLVPMVELAPDWSHPVLGLTMQTLLSQLEKQLQKQLDKALGDEQQALQCLMR